MSFSKGFKSNAHVCKYWIQMKQADEERDLPARFIRYDKELKEDVECDLTKGFVVLDYDLITITGYSETLGTGLFSNEVRYGGILKVQCVRNGKKEVIAEGSYAKIKDTIKSKGGKYTQSIYILIEAQAIGVDEPGYVIANLRCGGAFYEGWRDFLEKVKPSEFQSNIIQHDDQQWAKKQRGTVKYLTPIFKFKGEIDSDLAGEAIKADEELQAFLTEHLSRGGEVLVDSTEAQDYPPDDDPMTLDDCLEFKLKDGTRVGDLPIEQLKSMLNLLDERNFPQSDKKYVAIKSAWEYKCSQVDDDDDDIPF